LAAIFTAAVDEAPVLDVAADVELAGAAALLVAELPVDECVCVPDDGVDEDVLPPQPASASTTAGRAKPKKIALRTGRSLHFDHGARRDWASPWLLRPDIETR
jgi:hypothetical protein